MKTKEFIKKVFNLTAIIYTITTLIMVLGFALTSMVMPPDVNALLLFLVFSFFSSLSITIAKLPRVASVKYLVECGGMSLSFLLFVVLPREGITFPSACGWFFGFIILYILARVVIGIMVYDEKSTKKKVKASQKKAKATAKKSREDAIAGKNKKDEVEYTSLFSSDKK